MNSKLILFLISFLLIVIISSNQAFAETVTWDGDGDSRSWSDPENWSNNKLPSSEDEIIIDNDFDNESKIHLDSNFTLYGTLLLDGDDVLIVDNGMKFTIFGSMDNIGILENFGQFYNHGFIRNNESASLINSGTGLITNNAGGRIDNTHKLAVIDNKNGGTILNKNGSVINNHAGQIINANGSIKNGGVITNFDIIINNGNIVNNHTIENNNMISNHCDGSISGEFISGQFIHDGCKIWTGKEKGKWNNYENWLPLDVPKSHDEIRIDNGNWNKNSNVILDDDFINSSGITITDGDSLTLISGSKLTNKHSTIQNFKTISLNGFSSIDNVENNQFKNFGIINNDANTILNDGGVIQNSGMINNNFLGIINNANDGIIDNIYGIINNTNKITNYCPSIIKNIHPQNISGESVVLVPCPEFTSEDSSPMETANNCNEQSGADFIHIVTDREKYDAGDTIRITGCVTDTSHSKGLNIQIMGPDGNMVKASTIVPQTNGSFFTQYDIDKKFGIDGDYYVMAEFGDYSSTKTFTVPEFGMLTMMMLLISVIGVVLLTAKSRISL